MNSTNPASLQNLNDIVLPEPVGWWPLASGWYLLTGILLIVLAAFIYRAMRLWIRNRYRRTALAELRLLSAGIGKPTERYVNLRQVPSLLKRVALSAYPRSEVAILSGQDWYGFLNSTVGKPVFTGTVCTTLDKIAYSSRDLEDVSNDTANALLNACERWIKDHKPTTVSKTASES